MRTSISTSDLIQLGMLAVAALGALASATYYTYKWVNDRFFTVNVDISFPIPDLRHITSVTGGRGTIEVSRVGIWMRLTVINSGTKARLITAIRGFEEGCKARNTIASVKSVDRKLETIEVHGPISLPLRLEHQDAVTMWTVIEAEVPQPLSRALGEVYGIGRLVASNHARYLLQNLEAGETWVKNQISPDLQEAMGVTLADLKLGPITVGDPLVDVNARGEAGFRERLGHLPELFYSDLIRHARANGLLSRIEATPFAAYVVEVVLNNGRTLRRKAKIDTAFWFMHAGRLFGV